MSGSWLYMMLKAALCMGAFYMVYSLFLKRDTHFALTRYYLLGTATLSMFIPLFHLKIPMLAEPNSYAYILDTISVGSRLVEDAISDDRTILQFLMAAYFAGASVAFISLLFRIGRLIIIVKRNGWEYHNGMKLVFLPESSASPFSFFNYIFISREHYRSPTAPEMLMHEKVHIRQLHSLDLLLLEVIFLLQWFNPVIWFCKRSMKQVHEYLADEGVINRLPDTAGYQAALLSIGSGFTFNPLAHHFNHSLLKRRFIMMNKSKSLPFSRWKFVTLIPVTALLLLVFSDATGNYLDQALSWEQPGKAIIGPLTDLSFPQGPMQGPTAYQTLQGGDDSVFTKVEEAPTFKGGHEALAKYMTQNITYPEGARKQGIKGTVFISFMIDEKGKVTNGKVLRGIGGGCDEEALRVVMSMPDWNPGKNEGAPVKVIYNLPVKFSLSNEVKGDTKKDTDQDVDKDIDPE